jgi:histidyl-tRNA synthetase
MIILCLKILEKVGVKDKELKINTLGCADDKGKLSRYLKQALNINRGKLCDDCKRRLQKNPLRVLDCKRQECKRVASSLDMEQKSLCASCKEKFKSLLFLLDDLGVKYTYIPYLVRGLDYYTNTVFEVTSHKLGSQDAIGAGGRYNNLVKSLGGPDIPAIGFALGVERILLVLGEGEPKQQIDIFVAVVGKSLLTDAFKISKKLREEGFSCDYDYCGKSLKGQLRFAQKRDAKFVVIIGEDEVKENSVILRDMETSTQEKVEIKDLVSTIRRHRQ